MSKFLHELQLKSIEIDLSINLIVTLRVQFDTYLAFHVWISLSGTQSKTLIYNIVTYLISRFAMSLFFLYPKWMCLV